MCGDFSLSSKAKEVESANERAKRVHGDANGKTTRTMPYDYSPEEGPTSETLLAVVSRSQTHCVRDSLAGYARLFS